MTTTSAHLIDVSPNAPASVSLAAVDKVYGSGQNTVVALDKLSLSFARGTFTAVMGPSGSGKSTFSTAPPDSTGRPPEPYDWETSTSGS